MRDDMARVIVERPRIGGHGSRKGRAVALEDLPRHEGVRRRHKISGNWKSLNENLAPLRRFLDKQVGRPWDKVFADISARLRPTNAVQQHVRDHLKDFVAVKPRRGVGRRWLRDEKPWYEPLYVDPRDGILKRTADLPEVRACRRKEAARKRQAPAIDRVALTTDRELREVDGIWYEAQLASLPNPQYRAATEVRYVPAKGRGKAGRVTQIEVPIRRLITPAVRDAITGEAILAGPELDDAQAWHNYKQRHGDRRYVIAKRQISTTELRRHGLTNRETKTLPVKGVADRHSPP